MNRIYGLDIIVSPLIKDRAKLRFDPSFLGGSTRTIEEFNRWLEERFGVKWEYLITPNAIYCSARGFDALKQATAHICSIPVNGGQP